VSRKQTDSRCLKIAIVFLLLLLGTAMLAVHPDWFDRPLAERINILTNEWQFADAFVLGLTYPTLEGVIVLSLVWCCWFSDIGAEGRASMVSGVFAALCAALVARFLQYTLPTAPKPIFDTMIALHFPPVLGDIESLRATGFANSHAFPSERVTMFAGLGITVFLVRRKLGLFAIGATTVIEISRIYLGLHYPTDILGSFSLAAFMAWLAQMQWGSKLGLPFVRWENVSASTFYMCAFFACYQMTTAFQDLRDFVAQVLR